MVLHAPSGICEEQKQNQNKSFENFIKKLVSLKDSKISISRLHNQALQFIRTVRTAVCDSFQLPTLLDPPPAIMFTLSYHMW